MSGFAGLLLARAITSIGRDVSETSYQQLRQNTIALSGLAYNLRRSDHLYPAASGFENMASLSGLICSWWICFFWNYQLTTLDDLQNLRGPPGGPSTTNRGMGTDYGGGFY